MAKLASTRLDNEKVFEHCQDFLKKRNHLASKVEHTTEKKEKLIAIVAESAKVIANLQAQLKETELTMSALQNKMKESELEAAKEKEANKEPGEELLMFKKEVMEQHKKEFFKAINQAKFFIEGLDLGLFDPSKDIKDGELLDKEDIVVGEEKNVGEEENDEANV